PSPLDNLHSQPTCCAPHPMNEIKVSAPELLRFCTACFEKAGLSASDARLTANNLLFANLRGVDSHGVIRLKVYIERLQRGGFKADAQPEIISEQPSSVLMDARHGVGQVAAMAAMKVAIEKARKTGLAIATVRNSN